ncbi:MAG: superoxide dismutase family protein [Bacteroidota bacterium]
MKNLWVFIGLVAFGCSSESEVPFEPEILAEAEIFSLEKMGDDQYTLLESTVGIARFAQDGEVVELRISLEGMVPNTSKAVHIHNGFVETPGRHWNQGSFYAACNERSLGKAWAKPFFGDVGNVAINDNGSGEFILRTDLWRINSGDEKDLLNKVIIVHENPQDFVEECNPFHDHTHAHSNPKIGGGTIVLLSDIPINEQSFVKPEQMPDFLICK